ncbi:MAG: hypothetical protein QXZ68_04715 [Candidatus Bathyarchaeia archaeon]
MGRKRLKLRTADEAAERYTEGFVYHYTHVIYLSTPPPELDLVYREMVEKERKGEEAS